MAIFICTKLLTNRKNLGLRDKDDLQVTQFQLM